jgi:hypothetical protein
MPELGRIRGLELSPGSEEELLGLLGSENLVRLERLAIHGPTTAEVARAIAGSPACASLEELQLDGRDAAIGSDGVAALTALPLRALRLSQQRIGGKGALAISRISTLRALSIGQDRLGLEGARTLASAPALAGLRELALSRCELQPKGLASLAAAPGLGALRRLELEESVNAKTLTAMIEGWSLPSLRELSLTGPLREEGAAQLARCKRLGALESLTLQSAGLGDAGAAALSRWSTRLACVDLRGNGIGPDGMSALAKGPLLAHVRDLDLANNKCGGEGGKHLAEGKWLAHLRRLRLFYNWMGVHGLRAILERTPEIEKLDLGENNYGAEVFRVAARGVLPRLVSLDLGDRCDQKLLEAYLGSGHARELGTLGVHHVTIREETARLLACLPSLADLRFSFCSFEKGVLDILDERLRGLVTFWPGDD